MAVSGFWDDCPTRGRSMVPVTIMGAVTIKIMSRTSVTSIYGTTLISLNDRRDRRPRETIGLPMD
jgi:hypothetical protein